jgi:hypothetical protein
MERHLGRMGQKCIKRGLVEEEWFKFRDPAQMTSCAGVI